MIVPTHRLLVFYGLTVPFLTAPASFDRRGGHPCFCRRRDPHLDRSPGRRGRLLLFTKHRCGPADDRPDDQGPRKRN